MRKRSKKRSKLSIVLTLMCEVAAILVVVGVGAYFFKSSSFDNLLRTVEPKVILSEKFDPTDKWVPGEQKEKEVKFGNEGNNSCYLRARFIPKLTLADGTEVTDADVLSGFALVYADNFGTNWVDGGDGWFYYKSVLAPGAATPVTLESVKISRNISNDVHGIKTDYTGSTYEVLIEGEFIQTIRADEAAAENGWQVMPSAL